MLLKKPAERPSEGSGFAGWLAVGCFWLTTLAMAAVFVAGGKILDSYTAKRFHLYNTQDTHGAFSALSGMSHWWWGVAILGILIQFIGKFAEIWLESQSQIVGENAWRRRVVAKTFERGPARIKQEQLGSMVSMATESAEKLTDYTHSFQPQVKGSFSAPIILIVVMGIFVHPLLAFLVLCCLPLIPLGIAGFMKFFRKVSSGSARARSSLAAAYLDALGGLTTLQLLGAGARVARRLESVGEKNRQATMRLLRSNQLVILVLDAVFSLFTVTATAALSAYFAFVKDITPGQALTGMGLALLLLEPIDHFGAFFYVAMAGRGAKRRIHSFLSEDSRKTEASPGSSVQTNSGQSPHGCVETAAHRQSPGGEVALVESLGKAVELRQVCFSYGEKPVLTKVNLSVSPGERVAIVGASGQGKTTLLNLMKGFLTPQSGLVTVGGKTTQLTQQTALVSQNTWLFTGSIRENLVVAAPTPPSEKQLWQALTKARIDQEIRELPAGLDTNLGENGAGLSSGQKQRLSLARAFVSTRKILLLDEVTSQVDLESEREIMTVLRELGAEYTLIMVTHRSAVTKLATRVWHVESGEVTE